MSEVEQARAAWEHEARRATELEPSASVLVHVASLVGAAAVVAIGARLEAVVHEAAWGWSIRALFVVLAFALVAWPVWERRVARRRARVWLERARAADSEMRCPRCDAPLLARAASESGARECGACGAALAEAEGLLIVAASEPPWRASRWRAQARARLRAVGAPSVPRVGAARMVGATLASLAVLCTIAGLAGGAVGTPVPAEAALEPDLGPAGRARALDDEPMPLGALTRPRAPLWLGTQVLARLDDGPYHRFAVIASVDGARAFVVFADGSTAWVRGDDLLAPELAAHDRVEVFDGARHQPAELEERIGEALRVTRADGTSAWTSAARVRVRGDAAHARGEGLQTTIPPGAWVEVRVASSGEGQDTLRPGVAVRTGEERLLVALSDGSDVETSRRQVRTQHVEPGVRVWVEGWPEPVIVARRVGHALAVVDSRGRRSWTALARVRRRIDP